MALQLALRNPQFKFIVASAGARSVVCTVTIDGTLRYTLTKNLPLSLVATQFSHANIKLPRKVDTVLSYVLVSPDMHKVHHHYMLPYTDSNYGNIFSIWDRLFGTFMKLDRETIVYGVDTFPNEEENSNIKDLLKQPFHKYRKPTSL